MVCTAPRSRSGGGGTRVVEGLEGVAQSPDRRGEPQVLGRVGGRRKHRTGWPRGRHRWPMPVLTLSDLV